MNHKSIHLWQWRLRAWNEKELNGRLKPKQAEKLITGIEQRESQLFPP